jgi:hypothetical protein
MPRGELKNRVDMPKLLNVQLIATTVCRGEGKTFEDPCRTVEQWCTPDGTFVLEYDSQVGLMQVGSDMLDFLRQAEKNVRP